MNQPPQGWGGPPQSQPHPPQSNPGFASPNVAIRTPKRWSKAMIGIIVAVCSAPVLFFCFAIFMSQTGRWHWKSSDEIFAEKKAQCKPPNIFRRIPGSEKKGLGPNDPTWFECVNEATFASTQIDEARKKPLGKIIPWWDETRKYCPDYKMSKNEIKKSEVFNRYKAYMETFGTKSFENVPAKVKSLETPRGGRYATVVFEVKDAFTMEQKFEQTDPNWATISEVREGSWVLISAEKVRPISTVTEESTVCFDVCDGDVTKVLSDEKKTP